LAFWQFVVLAPATKRQNDKMPKRHGMTARLKSLPCGGSGAKAAEILNY
jgi:hypothetical protein